MNKPFFLSLLGAIILTTVPLSAKPKLIMLDPAGHAKDTGRQLHHGYERAETFKCAETVKKALEGDPELRVLLSRTPGDELVPLQNASFANRLNADLFIRLSFYKAITDKPKIEIYHLMIDSFDNKSQGQTGVFTPINQAHCPAMQTSINYAQKLTNLLAASEYQSILTCAEPKGLPLKQLVGIASPAILIEVGLGNDDQWPTISNALISSLKKIITEM